MVTRIKICHLFVWKRQSLLKNLQPNKLIDLNDALDLSKPKNVGRKPLVKRSSKIPEDEENVGKDTLVRESSKISEGVMDTIIIVNFGSHSQRSRSMYGTN